MRIPKSVEEGEDGVKYFRDREDKLYKLVCPKCDDQDE